MVGAEVLYPFPRRFLPGIEALDILHIARRRILSSLKHAADLQRRFSNGADILQRNRPVLQALLQLCDLAAQLFIFFFLCDQQFQQITAAQLFQFIICRVRFSYSPCPSLGIIQM